MILDVTKTYLIDLDGTMYRGNEVIDEAVSFIQLLQRYEISFVFVTNNAMRTPAQICQKMKRMGFTGLQEELFFTSAMAAVRYMRRTSDATRVFCIGEEGLQKAVHDAGYVIDEQHAQLVFVGLDRQADYSLYTKALRLLYEEKAVLVGTNEDRRVPDGSSYLIGNGAVLKMLAYASEAKTILIGKPSSYMMEETLAYVQKAKEDCIVIGDNLETDIAFAQINGVASIMVTTGVHTEEDLARFPYLPDVIVPSLADLHIK